MRDRPRGRVNAAIPGAGARVHFVGVGGIGMSWLAELLHARGCRVTGSDREASAITNRLAGLGIGIRIGHAAEAADDAELLVYTPAVGDDNPELSAGRRRGIPVLRRKELLGAVTRDKHLVAVAGTHGKTTTTALVTAVLARGGLDPTALIGGVSVGSETNLRVGGDAVWVVEADEYDRAFLELTPGIAIVTSLEADHLDQYDDEAAVRDAFRRFVDRTTPDGRTVICVDADPARLLCEAIDGRPADSIVSYGIDREARLRAADITPEGFGSRFRVVYDGSSLGTATLRVPGRHNVANALAAVAAGLAFDLPWPAIAEGLAEFQGVRRRFEVLGEAVDEILVVSDYAHHPTEIRATLAAARAGWDGPITAIFQPHLYSRTRDFLDAFGGALAEADRVVVTDIYAAREAPIPGITGEAVADAVRRAGQPDVAFIGDLDALATRVAREAKPGDLLLVMGAGSIEKAAAACRRLLETRSRTGR